MLVDRLLRLMQSGLFHREDGGGAESFEGSDEKHW